MSAFVNRNLALVVKDLLATFRVVILGGARQSGKTTLVRQQLNLPDHARLTLDDPAVLARAINDPVGFLEVLPRPSAIDEFQRAGEPLLLAIKQAADQDRTRGQILLTGSANYLASRSISETLAGRAGRGELWPLSIGERLGVRETFIDHLFSPASWPVTPSQRPKRHEIAEMVLEGGYPEPVVEGLTGQRRRTWFETYVADVVSREALRSIADVRQEAELRRLFRLLAARSSQELVISDLAADAELSRETVTRYVALLEALYLVKLVPAWSTSATTRAKLRPKILPTDSGLAADLAGVGESAFGPHGNGVIAGALFETLILVELHKQAGWAEATVDLFHFRDRHGAEIDLIVEERRSGKVAGVEVKLTATPTAAQARHLSAMRDQLGERFTVGVLLHTGPQALPLGDRIWALPFSAIWRADPSGA